MKDIVNGNRKITYTATGATVVKPEEVDSVCNNLKLSGSAAVYKISITIPPGNVLSGSMSNVNPVTLSITSPTASNVKSGGHKPLLKGASKTNSTVVLTDGITSITISVKAEITNAGQTKVKAN